MKNRYITDIRQNYVLNQNIWYKLNKLRFNPIWRLIIIVLVSIIIALSIKLLFDTGFFTF